MKTTKELLEIETHKAVKEFIDNGGKIQYVDKNYRTPAEDIISTIRKPGSSKQKKTKK